MRVYTLNITFYALSRCLNAEKVTFEIPQDKPVSASGNLPFRKQKKTFCETHSSMQIEKIPASRTLYLLEFVSYIKNNQMHFVRDFLL